MTRKQLAALWRIPRLISHACPFCSIENIRGNDESQYAHRHWHRKTAFTLPPRPDKRIAALNLHADLRVSHDGPRWMHQMVYERNRRLALEQESRIQWSNDGSHWQWSKHRPTPPHAILMIERDDIAVGVVAFSNGQQWSNVPPGWLMMFAWVAPEWRRQGVLSRRWDAWRAQYDDFIPCPPLSEEMKAFCTKRGHPTEITTAT